MRAYTHSPPALRPAAVSAQVNEEQVLDASWYVPEACSQRRTLTLPNAAYSWRLSPAARARPAQLDTEGPIVTLPPHTLAPGTKYRVVAGYGPRSGGTRVLVTFPVRAVQAPLWVTVGGGRLQQAAADQALQLTASGPPNTPATFRWTICTYDVTRPDTCAAAHPGLAPVDATSAVFRVPPPLPPGDYLVVVEAKHVACAGACAAALGTARVGVRAGLTVRIEWVAAPGTAAYSPSDTLRLESVVRGGACGAYLWTMAPVGRPSQRYPLERPEVAPTGRTRSSLRVLPHVVGEAVQVTLECTDAALGSVAAAETIVPYNTPPQGRFTVKSLANPQYIYSGDTLVLAAVAWKDADTPAANLLYQFSYDLNAGEGPVALNAARARTPVMTAAAPYLATSGIATEVCVCSWGCGGHGKGGSLTRGALAFGRCC